MVTLGNGLTVNANVKFEAGGRGHVYQIDGNIVESAGSGIFRGYWNATSLDGALRNITNRADDAWNKANDAQVNRVQDMRLGGLESSQVWNAQGYSDQPPYVITGVHNFNNDAVIDIIYRRPLQKFVSGGWHNISGI